MAISQWGTLRGSVDKGIMLCLFSQIATLGLMSREDFDTVERMALQLFEFGQVSRRGTTWTEEEDRKQHMR